LSERKELFTAFPYAFPIVTTSWTVFITGQAIWQSAKQLWKVFWGSLKSATVFLPFGVKYMFNIRFCSFHYPDSSLRFYPHNFHLADGGKTFFRSLISFDSEHSWHRIH